MPQEDEQSAQAGQRTQETRSFLRQVRAATHRKYTPEEKIRIVLEGFRRETTVNDLCRREGIKPHSYYAWTKEFMEAGKERLTRDSVRDATRQGGILKKCVNSQAVYPLSEQHGLKARERRYTAHEEGKHWE